MSTITLPNIRVGSDLQVRVRLKDGGVAIDWSTLSNIKACIYSDAQRALAGRCAFSIDEEDNTLLVCTYAANKPQYLGVNRIVISAKYMGETKTYDKPAFSFVRWTADQEGEEITIDDPDVDVEIDVEDISSSILQEAVDAAFTAADRANDAAAAAEHMVDIHTGPEGKSAYEVAVEEGYTGTEEEWLASLVGPQGAQGIQGETGEAAGFGSVSAALQEDGGDPSVVVSTSGEDTSKNFAFTFKNLKGDKGDKGDQGNTGSSVDYPYELVNNCTTDDATKGLAASQGVALQAEVSQLEAKVDGNPKNYTSGEYLKANGTTGENSAYGISDYIPYESGNDVLWRFDNTNNGTYYILFYREDKTLISGSDFSAQYNEQNQGRLITITQINTYAPNAAYIRASYTLLYADAQVKVGNDVAWKPQEKQPSLSERISALQEEVEDVRTLAVETSNEVNGTPANFTSGQYLKANGDIESNSAYGVSDFIPYVSGNDVLWKFDNANNLDYYLLFYASDKSFISGSDYSAQYQSQYQGDFIPAASINQYAPNAAYIRASFTLSYADAEVRVGNESAWTPVQGTKSLQEQINDIAGGDYSIFTDCICEQIELVGKAFQRKYVFKQDHEIVDSQGNGSFIIQVSVGDKILVRGSVNGFANYSILAFTDNLTAGYSAGVKNLVTLSADTNPYTYQYVFVADKDGYLMAWTTEQGYGSSLYVEMFRLKERQGQIFDRYLPETLKIQTFGDSITDNYWGDMSSWVSYIPDNIKNTALTIVNSAVGGAGIGGDGEYNIPHQVMDGYTRTGGTTAPPLDSTSDIVVIFCGTNDYAGGQPLVSVTGNLATTFQYIFEHSKAKVLFCTPLQRYNITDQGFDTDSDGVPVNSQGYTLRELCDEIIKVCKRFSVPVLDLNAEANINRYNILDYSLDGLHPQRWGDAYVSRLICEKIKAMMRYDLQ